MKTCTKCGSTKSETEFYKLYKNKGKLMSWCKTCSLASGSARKKYRTRYDKKYMYDVRYDRMCRRVSGYYKRKYPVEGKELLSKEEYYKWCEENEAEFDRLLKDWELHDFILRYAPSIDRIDNNRGYTSNNMQWLSYIENTIKGKKVFPI